MSHPPRAAVAWVGLGSVVVLGFFLRLWMLRHAPVNGDNAIVGLMAQDILDGRFYTFYFGQFYGGVEPYFVALFSALIPDPAFAVNATPAILSFLAALTVWRLGLLVTGSRVLGVAAGCLSWIWPEVNLWNSTREMGFRGVTLLCGLGLLHLTVRIATGTAMPRQWLLLGFVAGVGFWSSPEIGYFGLPCGLILGAQLLRGRARLLRLWRGRIGLATLGFLVGASPWLFTNLQNGFLSLQTGTADSTYWARFQVFFEKVLPMLLGLRIEGNGVWIGGRSFGLVLLGGILVLVATGAAALALRVPTARVLVLFCALFPVVYAAFPPTLFWNDARFGGYLAPVLPVVVFGGLSALNGHTPRLDRIRHLTGPVAAAGMVVLFSLAVVSTLISFNRTFGSPLSRPSDLFALSSNPNRLVEETISELRRARVTRAYADYWIAGPVSFLSDRAVIVDSLVPVRWTEGHRRVQESGVAAWLFVDPAEMSRAIPQFQQPSFSPEIGVLTSYLDRQGISFQVLKAGLLQAVRPARHVRPQDLGFQVAPPDG